MKTKIAETFHCEGSDGKHYSVMRYALDLEASITGDDTLRLDGITTSYLTTDNEEVECVDGIYRLGGTFVFLTRIPDQRDISKD